MKRTTPIVDALRRESVTLRSAPACDLVPAVEAALARDRRSRRRRVASLVACAVLATVAARLPFRAGAPEQATGSPDRLAAREPGPAWDLEPSRLLRLSGSWWSGLQAPLRQELAGLGEDARKVASAVARRLPDSFAARWDG